MHIRTAAVLLAAATLAAGCSSSSHDNSSKPKTPSTTTAAAGSSPKATLEAAVRAYSADFFKPDADAGYALLSTSCKANTSREEYGAQLALAVKMYGHQQIKTLHVVDLSGDLARVTYTYSDSTLNQTRQPWAMEGGAWKYDGC